MVSSINNSATINVSAHGTYQLPSAISANSDHGKPTAPESEPAAILDVSERGRELAALQIRYNIDKSIFKSDDDTFFSLEARAQSKANSTQAFLEADKLRTEISRLITGTYDPFGDPNETLEERVMNREKGLKLAEYLAEKYIDNPIEKQSYLDGVKQLAKNAEQRDLNPIENFVGFMPGYKEAYKAAYMSISKTDFADENARSTAVNHEAIKTLLRDPKYKEIADRYDAGEISIGAAFVYMSRLSQFGNIYGPSFGNLNKAAVKHDISTVTEKAVADAIDRIKSSLDMNAVREDVQRTIKEITANILQNYKLPGLSTPSGRLL